MKPRRGRKPAGVVRDWANKFDLTNRLFVACLDDQLDKIMKAPVHIGNLGECAGRCIYPRWNAPDGCIEIHEELAKPGREAEFADTFIHELGHMLDWLRRGRSDHSALWRKTMADLGDLNPSRTHSHPFIRGKTRHTKKVVYQCPDCGWNYYTSRRFSGSRYHKRCASEPNKGVLRLIEITE